jgi:hypothetical protein
VLKNPAVPLSNQKPPMQLPSQTKPVSNYVDNYDDDDDNDYEDDDFDEDEEEKFKVRVSYVSSLLF